MSNPTQDSQSELDKNKFGISFAVAQEELKQSKDQQLLNYMTEKYSAALGIHIGKNKPWEVTPMAGDKLLIKRLEVVVFTPTELEAYVTTRVKEALELARSKDPHKCEFGHEVYSHNTVDGWCCACEADQAFMDGRVKEAEELLRAEVNFYKDRCKMERNKYDILAKSTQDKVKEAERLARIDELTRVLTANNHPKFVALNLRPRGQIEIRERIEALTTTTNGKGE